MDTQTLKRFVVDSRYCSSTEKCSVACVTDDLSYTPWLDNLADAWLCLDQDQKAVVNALRREEGKPVLNITA